LKEALLLWLQMKSPRAVARRRLVIYESSCESPAIGWHKRLALASPQYTNETLRSMLQSRQHRAIYSSLSQNEGQKKTTRHWSAVPG
jgi:hypothetical protein